MSLATILTLTLVSLLYADTQRLGITHIPGFFFFNASASAWPITFPAPHFSKLAISSALNCINELSSITSSGFHTKTLVPPSLTFTQVWSRSGMNLIEFNSSSNNSGRVATALSGPASRLHKTRPTDWLSSSIISKSRVMAVAQRLSHAPSLPLILLRVAQPLSWFFRSLPRPSQPDLPLTASRSWVPLCVNLHIVKMHLQPFPTHLNTLWTLNCNTGWILSIKCCSSPLAFFLVWPIKLKGSVLNVRLSKQLDDGWPESVEEQSLLLLVWRHYITR